MFENNIIISSFQDKLIGQRVNSDLVLFYKAFYNLHLFFHLFVVHWLFFYIIAIVQYNLCTVPNPLSRLPILFISFPVVPPVLTVPLSGGVVNASEGGNAELVCLVDGKPRPPVLWSRANKDLPMPSGEWMVESRDGRLRLTNVSRDMMGAYRCQTAPYNGLNIKRRQAQVQLNVECKLPNHSSQNTIVNLVNVPCSHPRPLSKGNRWRD